jgi:tRNA A-37 threonylcarbamoyl transferase component Bud32
VARPRHRELLKQSLHRSVYLESWEEEGRPRLRVVKRFRAADPLRRMLDGRRARRERRALQRLRSAGLPVPCVLELVRRAGAWELATEHLESARDLESLLEGRAPWPVASGSLARRLGVLAARAHAVGLEHADLHAGNVMIDEDGGVWLVDCAHARLRTRAGRPDMESELAQFAAGVRERVHPSFRMRFLVAYLREAAARGFAARSARGALAARVENAARRHRRSVLRHSRLRWTRLSSAVRPIRTPDGAGFLRRDLEESLLQELRSEVPPTDGTRRFLTYRDSPYRSLRERWYDAARLRMHGIDCAIPVCLLRGEAPRMTLELPSQARPAREVGAARSVAHALGVLMGTLDDRGLELRSLDGDALWFVQDQPRDAASGKGGRMWLAPGARIENRGSGRTGIDLARILGATSSSLHAAFVAGYLSASRGGPAERRRWREELRRG